MGRPYGSPAQQRSGPAYGEPAAGRRRPSGVTAVAAALLGLVAAVAAGYLPVTLFIDIPSGFSLGDLPMWTLVDLGGYLGAGLFLLVGAVATIFRATAGAVLLILGALIAIGSILLEPTLGNAGYADYFQVVFSLKGFAAVDRAVLVVLSPIILVLAALPPTFSFLRYRTSAPGQW
ncbi:hypothetical protein [Amycolatopsis sp. FDAARGOS 1241]|uniref:hypothetical protein n=1 Tax=Amycolatopsis sp. FDAARGOS 1241 TaxID=2778070 RepID=UPI001EF16BB6|nr:hypothetical protein [Amycolatopsis sp. FDAARGOS 1241]